MKKLISVFGLSLALVAADAATLRTNLSFMNPLVVSVMLTNTVPISNLLHGVQIGGVWTNGAGQAQANGYGMTNLYVGANANTMYTQIVAMASASSPSGFLVGGTNLPGVLVVDVNTNLNNSLTGVMGIPPFSASNLTWAKTNDALNIFQDVYFPSDWSPMYGGTAMAPLGLVTNLPISYSAAIEVQLLGSQLNGSANGSNYVALVFAPLASDGTEIVTTQLPAAGTYGNFQSMNLFTLNVTNSASTTALCTQIIPIPTQYVFGASGLRLLSATPGVAWSTGGSMWLTRCRLILITQ